MKMYIFICVRVQRKNKCTFSNYTFSNLKTLFALLVTHKEKCPSRMPVNLKKTEFAPAGVQARSSSPTFHLEVTGVGGKVQSKKLYRLKCKLLHLHPRCGCYVRSWSYYRLRSCRTLVLKKHNVFYTSMMPEVTWYEPLYNAYLNEPQLFFTYG